MAIQRRITFFFAWFFLPFWQHFHQPYASSAAIFAISLL
jgi:hypothetical protein